MYSDVVFIFFLEQNKILKLIKTRDSQGLLYNKFVTYFPAKIQACNIFVTIILHIIFLCGGEKGLLEKFIVYSIKKKKLT